jgi:hypothetical protein
MLLPDSSGHWKAGEVKESTAKEDAKNRISEERISRPDSDARLAEVSRTVAEETETALEVPGVAGDASLHLSQRITTIQKKDSAGTTTAQQVEEPNPSDPQTSLQLSTKTKCIVQYASSGTPHTKTTQVRDINGNFNVVTVETGQSGQTSAAKAHTTPSDKLE